MEIFYTQNEAVERAALSNDLHVFSFEPITVTRTQGARKFLTSTFDNFWDSYREKVKRNEERHYYEVILEDAPCHLYFDLEFSTLTNPTLDGEKLVDDIIERACEKIDNCFGVTCTEENVLRLDASYDRKFSQHLIFHLPGCAFRSNHDVGDFVRDFCHDNAEHFLVCGSNADQWDDQMTCMVDTGVYSRNRNFRLFRSTKKGKTAALLRSSRCEFNLKNIDVVRGCCVYHSAGGAASVCGDVDELIFYASLITNVASGLKMLTFGQDRSFQSNKSRTVIPASDRQFQSQATQRSRSQATQSIPDRRPHFKSLYDFIESMVQGEGMPGCVREYYHLSGTSKVIFEIEGNRFCHNIGRQHRSNHVYYVVDLGELRYYQKCHDPECRGFKSQPSPLPDDVVNSLNEDDMIDCDVTDEELVEFVEMQERQNVT